MRQVWQSLKSVLEDLDQQCWSEDESEAMQPEPERSMGPPDNGALHSEAEKGKGAPGSESGAEQGASGAAPHASGSKDGSVGPMHLDAADHSDARQSEQQGLGRLHNAEEGRSAPQSRRAVSAESKVRSIRRPEKSRTTVPFDVSMMFFNPRPMGSMTGWA